MTQENPENSSVDPSSLPLKRKRGRPRKDGGSASVSVTRNQRRKVNPTTNQDHGFVGQVVSGVLDGTFDAGYILTVRVGTTGTVMRGVVFDPSRSIPVSAANDVMPQLKMLKRDEIPLPMAEVLNPAPVSTPIQPVLKKDIPVKPLQRNEPGISSKVNLVNHASGDLSFKLKNCSSGNEKQGMLNDANHVPQDMPHALKPEIKPESYPILHGVVGEAKPSSLTTALPLQSELKNPLVVDTTDVKLVTTDAPSDVSMKETSGSIQASEHETEQVVEIVRVSEDSHRMEESSVNASRTENSEKILMGNEKVGGTPDSMGQVPQVHSQISGTKFESEDSFDGSKSQPAEFTDTAPAASSQAIPEILQGNKTSLSDQVPSSDAL